MIQSKKDYIFYLKADEIALKKKRGTVQYYRDYLLDDIWRFERLLRKREFYINCKKGIIYKLYLPYLYFKFQRLSTKLGFTIPPNVFGPGLSIAHKGTLIVNSNAKVGENCRIHTGVNIGTNAYSMEDELRPDFVLPVPKIGNNVYIGPGVKIFGDIEIADNIAIGANSVVNKSFKEEGITIAGVPAKKVSSEGFDKCYYKATDILRGFYKPPQ
ncbi:serine O-acetyltransferase [Methanosarcina barkeri str. Wiesmoor]|uniref:Serine O-acetyltransferase n=2 Tax=Methanosarcina barkeri TaxID=2208 RepID=A0A0E3LKM5_METBA|nr:serine acetyltransferase [Methanosarcina barkeri]AKB49781.1 serine O-acetyltransferase [Methanosarcina barkeri str. Wiesmoor]